MTKEGGNICSTYDGPRVNTSEIQSVCQLIRKKTNNLPEVWRKIQASGEEISVLVRIFLIIV